MILGWGKCPLSQTRLSAFYHLGDPCASPFLSSLFSSFFVLLKERRLIYTTIIGIDVSKKELIGVRINKAGKEAQKYQLENTSDAISAFLSDLNQKHKHVVIAAESTSDFHCKLALTCLESNIPLRLINPITTQQFVKVTVRGHKTDMSDALIIAKLALHGEGRYMQKEDFSFAKSVSRTASKLSEMERSVGNMLNRLNSMEDERNGEVSEVLKHAEKCWRQAQRSFESTYTKGPIAHSRNC